MKKSISRVIGNTIAHLWRTLVCTLVKAGLYRLGISASIKDAENVVLSVDHSKCHWYEDGNTENLIILCSYRKRRQDGSEQERKPE